ncbi:MAG TPA: universal stress protein, partial [Vicinamibacterales bacterium]
MRVLLAIDGSPSSDAAVNEVAHCTLFKGSAVEGLTVIHSRVPVIPDPAFTMLALRAEDLHQQESRAQALLDAAVRRIRRGRRSLTVS